MKTSYFANLQNLLDNNQTNLIGIAGKSSDQFTNHFRSDLNKHQYKQFAPKYWFFQKYKQDNDKQYYIEQYYELVLKPLNPYQVYQTLGDDSILLCWEKPGLFCHRRLVADWFKDKCNIIVDEYII